MMLAQLMALVLVSILSPLLAMAASLDPMKIPISSFGVAAAVARPNIKGDTVGNVDMAPFEMDWQISNQNRH